MVLYEASAWLCWISEIFFLCMKKHLSFENNFIVGMLFFDLLVTTYFFLILIFCLVDNIQYYFTLRHLILASIAIPCNVYFYYSAWDVKSAEPMIELLQTWRNLIPSWILDNILQQLIMPRIQHTADEWNPLIDTIPIHAWTHPWLPQLGNFVVVIN